MEPTQREPERRWNFSELRAVGYGNSVDVIEAPRIEVPYLHPKGASFALTAHFPGPDGPAITREEGDELVYAPTYAGGVDFGKQKYNLRHDVISTGMAFRLPEYFSAQPGHRLVFLPDGNWWYGPEPEKKLEEIAGEQAQIAREKLLNRDMLGSLRAGIHALNAGTKTVDTALLVHTLSAYITRYIGDEVRHLEAKRYEPDPTITVPTDEELKGFDRETAIRRVMAYGHEQDKRIPHLPIPFDATTPEEAKKLYEQGNKFVHRNQGSATRPDHFSALSRFQEAFWLAPLDLEIGASYHALGLYVAQVGLRRAMSVMSHFEWNSPVHENPDVFGMWSRVLREREEKKGHANELEKPAIHRRTVGIWELLNQPRGIDPDDDFA